MSTTKINYCVVRGDSASFRLAITNSESEAINTDNYNIYFTAKKSFDDVFLIDPIEAIVVDEANGIYLINIPSNITVTLPIGTFSYDIQLNDINGIKKTIFGGDFTVLPEYTTGV